MSHPDRKFTVYGLWPIKCWFKCWDDPIPASPRPYFVRFARANSIFGPYPQEQDRAVLTAKTACPNLEALANVGGGDVAENGPLAAISCPCPLAYGGGLWWRGGGARALRAGPSQPSRGGNRCLGPGRRSECPGDVILGVVKRALRRARAAHQLGRRPRLYSYKGNNLGSMGNNLGSLYVFQICSILLLLFF